MALTTEEFFDGLWQAYVATSGDDTTVWRPENGVHGWTVTAHSQDGEAVVANNLSEADADWLCTVWSAWPDIHRAVTDALTKAENADRDRDQREADIARLEIECRTLRQQIR